MSAPTRPRLAGIEALRGIAALAVLVYHAARHVDAAHGAPVLKAVFQAGHAGVDLFFVLSGFLILHVHRADIGRPERIGRYAWARWTRVLPLYWIALLLTVGMGFAGGHALPDAARFLHSALLLPGWEEPLLGPAWSLIHELLFYLVFAVLILHRRAGMTLLMLWAIAVTAAMAGVSNAAIPPQIVGAYNAEFFFGMGVALLLPHLSRGWAAMLAGGGFLLIAAAAETAGALDGHGLAARFAYGLASALLIAGVARLSLDEAIRVPRWLERLGGASYAVYLFQFLFMGVAVKLWELAGLDGGAGLFVVMVAAGLVGGLATSALVEKPLLKMMRRHGI